MDLYHVEVVMHDESREVIILQAVDHRHAMVAAANGLREDGRNVHYVPVKRKVSKAKAIKLIEDGARCWASL